MIVSTLHPEQRPEIELGRMVVRRRLLHRQEILRSLHRWPMRPKSSRIPSLYRKGTRADYLQSGMMKDDLWEGLCPAVFEFDFCLSFGLSDDDEIFVP